MWRLKISLEAKKVMVLLYLDFARILEDSEQALVEDIVKKMHKCFIRYRP